MSADSTNRSDLDEPCRGSTVLGAITDACFRTAADYTYDWESWHAPDGHLVWVNPAVELLTGFSVAESLEMPDYPLPMFAAEHRGAVSDMLKSAQDGSSGNNVEVRAVHQRIGNAGWKADISRDLTGMRFADLCDVRCDPYSKR